MNIFASDLYRLRKGAAIRNTLIGLIIVIAFMGWTLFATSAGELQVFLDETASSQGASAVELAEMQDDFDEINQAMPGSGADFVKLMVASNLPVFFLLPFILSIFCADFNNGTGRNTLSFESSRAKVYLEKLLLCIVAGLALNLVTAALSALMGGILFGFGGMGLAFWSRLLVTILLMLPSQLGAIGFGYCLVALFQRSSAVIAIYLIGLTVLTAVVQLVSALRGLGWLLLLDWNAVGKLMLDYGAMATGQILLAVIAGLLIAAATATAGLLRYQKTDIA